MSTPKLKPLGKRVVIERAEAQQTKGGIFLPDSAQEKPKEGTVLLVGPGEINESGQLIPLTLKPGDRVLFTQYAGTEVEQEEKSYIIMKEDEILGIIES